VSSDLKVFVRILVNERTAAHGKALYPGGQWYWANHAGAGPFSGTDDTARRLIQYTMIVSF
jgi:hypothetical protein